jgi:hypothetical protein
MTTETIKKFNRILQSFLNQLAPQIGTTYPYKFGEICKINSTLAIEQFMVYALPDMDKIKSRDETYFTDDNTYTTKVNDAEDLNEILRLKNVYKILDEQSRTAVWDTFQVLLHLGEEYIKIKMKVK